MADDLTKPDTLESGAFEALESSFQEVLQELVGDQSLERFRTEYDKLHAALKKSHESEKRLIRKCRELNQEIVANAAKVHTALKLSQEDQNTIASLKREIEKAWKMVDTAHNKESLAKDTIGTLKGEIQNLSQLIEQGAGMSMGQEAAVKELTQVTKELNKERDAQAIQIQQLTKELKGYAARTGALDEDLKAAHANLQGVKEEAAEKKEELAKEVAKKEKLEAEVAETKQAIEAKVAENKAMHTEVAAKHDLAMKGEIAIREERGMTERVLKAADALEGKVLKVQKELEELAVTAKMLVSDHSRREVHIKLRRDELNSKKAELGRQRKLCEAYEKKIRREEAMLSKGGDERALAEARTVELEGELAAVQGEKEKERQAVASLHRERDVLNRSLIKAGVIKQTQLDQVRVHEKERKNLQAEIGGYKAEAQRTRKHMFLLEREGDKYGTEAAEAATRYAQALEEVQLREVSILQLEQRISDLEAKLKVQQSLYEAVRSDRNLYSKSLIEAQEEIAEMKRKFKIMNHQIEQLKEEIHSKDKGLVKEHFDHIKVEKEKELLKEQLAKQVALSSKNEEYVSQFEGESTRLNEVINDAESERQRQKKECEVVVSERDILGTQLIRRNDELALLYEKIRIQESSLEKGAQHYRMRVKEVDVLRQQIIDVQKEITGLGGSVAAMHTLRNEVYQLQRELLHERTKVRALSEELENPMNVHRWRKLEGSDPATFELVQKIHVLQKRLIEKSEEVVDKDLLLHRKDRLYAELKSILARQPGPEVTEQLSVYQASLAEREQQMHQMGEELSMFHAQAAEYKDEIGRITRELREVKRKFFEQKKKENFERDRVRAERAQEEREAQIMESRMTVARFTGGGFNLSQSAS